MYLLFLLLLIVAVFLRLFKIMGKNEYSNNEITSSIKPAVESLNTKSNNTKQNNSLTSKILAVKNVYSDFVPEIFVKQAEQTFDEVFNAFASSQHQVLKTKLSESLYEQFATQIQKRELHNLRQEISIKHKNTEIMDIKVTQSSIEITVNFKIEQVSAMVDMNGVSIDNPSKLSRSVQHVWVFVANKVSHPEWIITKTDAKEL